MLDGEAVVLGVDGVSDFNALHSREPAQCRPLDQRAPFIGEAPFEHGLPRLDVSARLAQELGQGPRATSSARLAECQHGAGSEKIRSGCSDLVATDRVMERRVAARPLGRASHRQSNSCITAGMVPEAQSTEP